MPTFREDLHLGHEVAMVDTDDIVNGAITEEKLGDGSVSTRTLQDKCVTEPKIDDAAVSTRTIQDKAITEPKLDDGSVSHRTIQNDAVEGDNIKPGSIENKHLTPDSVEARNIKDGNVPARKLGSDVKDAIVMPPVNSLNEKFTNITNELYDMIASLQVGGIALSNQFGDREDIGITQKALTRMFGAIWDKIAEFHPGHNFFDFTLTVNPLYIFNEIVEDPVNVIADCSDAISNFDSIRVYVNDELEPRAESRDVTHFETTVTITETSTIRVVGTILGRVIEKTATVINEIPFFMGGGQNYQDIMTEEYRKDLDGTLEGDYDLVVKHSGEHMFIIIPASRKSEFRRVNMKTPDMGGFEIPLDLIFENEDYVVYKSKAPNGYLAGTYNVDININS